jgi:predicted DNA-binding protein (MmcQ/YjbR family)
VAKRHTRNSLLALALTFPEAFEDHPWGETVVKVNGKIFLFLGFMDDRSEPRITVKLPESCEQALGFAGAERTGYGLGRAGWVTVPLRAVPSGLAEDWLEESYCVVAPRRLSRMLEGG